MNAPATQEGTIRHMAWLLDARTEAETHAAGTVIFDKGDDAKVMYVVREGVVNIEINGEIVHRIEAGGIFGEMALIDHNPRSATARAETDCELIAIDERKFLFFVDETPYFALDVMRVLASRLRAMDERV